MRNRILVLLLFCLGLNKYSYPADVLYGYGGRSAGMANTSVMFYNAWSALYNPAGITKTQGFGVGFHHETRYMIPALSVQHIFVIIPTSSGTFAATYNHFGYREYYESNYRIAYGKAFGERFSFGVTLDCLHTQIREYNKETSFTFDAGLITEPIDNFFLGVHVYNPVQSYKALHFLEHETTFIKIGAGYSIEENIYFALEAEKELSQKAVYKMGLEWEMVDHIFLRSGLSLNPVLPSFGIGYEIKKCQVDIAVNYHQVLGVSPQISIYYEW